MDCEICGSENARTPISMDNQKLIVCSNCTDLGEKIQENTVIKVNSFKSESPTSLSRHDDYTLVDGFGEKIRNARQQQNLSIKEMAEKIFEKESFLHKIEQEKHIPDKKLVEKIEKYFKINIIE